MADVPENSFQAETTAQWRSWLKLHHTRKEGVWLITFKKDSGKPRLDYDAAVEEALCWGWVDSLPRKLDEERTMLWFAPRKKGTGWSLPNKKRVEKMSATGRMQPAGLAKIEAAKTDGSWAKLDDVEALVIPEDLAKALAQFPMATTHFEAFPRSVKRGILEWIINAKKPETRAKRVDETAGLAAENKRANQWR